MSAVEPLPFLPAAVIFDMDGLMLDSERAILDALRQAAVEHDARIDHDWWLGLIGHSDEVCRARLGELVGIEAAEAVLARGHALYIAVAEAGIAHRPGSPPHARIATRAGS